MTLHQVRQAKAAEKAAKDAFYAQHAAEANPGSKPSAKYSKLQAAMIAATKARQAAMTAYAAALWVRVLVACEYSARVRDAFRRRGHDAWSCDLLECEADPQWHLQHPVEEVLADGWDLMVAHPPCTHLAVSGSRHFHRKQREQAEALDFVRLLMAAPIPRWCIENPVSIISTAITPPPSDHSALVVRSRRNQGDVLVAKEPAAAQANAGSWWSWSQGASDATGA
jgi:hypothetical protein